MSRSLSFAELNRLRYNVLLETLDDEQFSAIEPQLVERQFTGGEVLIQDEEQGEEIFFLVQGRVRISKTTATGEDQTFALLHPGDCFGELELIAGRPRSSRVTALEPGTAFVLGRAPFEDLLERSHGFVVRLLQVLSIRMRAMNYHFIRESNRKLESMRRELVKSSRLVEAARNLNSTLDLDKLLDIILDMALQIVDGDRGTVYLLDDGGGELWTKVTRGLDEEGKVTIRLPLGKGIAGYVAATGDTINIPDAYMDPRFNPDFDRQTGYRTESILCTPMRNKDGRIIGVFQLLNKNTGPFTGDDSSFLDALSLHASLAIENARLHEQERVKIRIERDLMAAREVQMSLLPKELPSIRGYEFAAVTVPALEVAGDLYDFVPLDEHRVAVSLGDVSGKGLPAALLMATIQATVRQQASSAGSPLECITRANRVLFQHTAPEKFVTLFYMLLDHQKHRIAFSNAGHEFPFLVSASGSVRRLEAGGVILGIVEEFPFEEDTVPMAKGDLLVIFSDGITDAPSGTGDQFGVHRLEPLIVEKRHLPAAQVLEAILAAVEAHAGDGAGYDDRTLVVLRRS